MKRSSGFTLIEILIAILLSAVVGSVTLMVTKQVTLTMERLAGAYDAFVQSGIGFSRDNLLNEVWGLDFFGSDRTVDTHDKSLRGKLQPCDYIETIWGFGYKLRY